MEKSVCIMTSEESFHNNYGAALQGYALFHTIKGMGYEPKIVRYKGGMQLRNKDLNFKGKIRQCLRAIYHFLFKTKEQKAWKKASVKYSNEIELREKAFNLFKESNMDYCNAERVGWYDLRENPPKADIYVCGSDQIWNPFFKGGENDLGYFLDFVPKGKKRIAYAPSFGCSKLPMSAETNISNLLNAFDYLSVREKEGADIVFNAIHKEIPVVADPTILLTREQWNSISTVPKCTPDEYILCYRFSNNDQTKKTIDWLSEKLNLPVLTLPLNVVSISDDYNKIFNAGPTDFIGLIKKATLICTDSFHAVVFSLLYNKPFFVFPRENFNNSNANMNSRVSNLLRISNLQNRFVSSFENIEIREVFSANFAEANKKLGELRMFSLEWLTKAMND